MFVRVTEAARSCTFEFVEWFAVPADGFASRSRFHFELSDVTRAARSCTHSHHGPWPAGFSGSDWAGFEEFVPHVHFEFVEWFAVPADGFASRSRFHFELSDVTRAA